MDFWARLWLFGSCSFVVNPRRRFGSLRRVQLLPLTVATETSATHTGTFTLSNVGSIGGTYTMPVVLSPEVRPARSDATCATDL